MKIVDFINAFPDGWDVPWYGPPVAAVHLSLWKGDKYVANFGISTTFITRDYGNFWSQTVSEQLLKEFAKTTHTAIYEGAFRIIPDGIDLDGSLNIAKSLIEKLDVGSDINSIYKYINESNMEITTDYDSFINVTIMKLRKGIYADTVIAGQYQLTSDRRLAKVRFSGVKIRKQTRSKDLKVVY